jgi:hypothetical protein
MSWFKRARVTAPIDRPPDPFKSLAVPIDEAADRWQRATGRRLPIDYADLVAEAALSFRSDERSEVRGSGIVAIGVKVFDDHRDNVGEFSILGKVGSQLIPLDSASATALSANVAVLTWTEARVTSFMGELRQHPDVRCQLSIQSREARSIVDVVARRANAPTTGPGLTASETDAVKLAIRRRAMMDAQTRVELDWSLRRGMARAEIAALRETPGGNLQWFNDCAEIANANGPGVFERFGFGGDEWQRISAEEGA